MWLAESSGSLLGAMSTDMMQFDMQEILPADKDLETKMHGVKNLLNSRFTFRLWQILVSLFVMTIIITVTGILAAKFGSASPCYKISGKETSDVFAGTKEDRGNLTFLPLRQLASSASILHSFRYQEDSQDLEIGEVGHLKWPTAQCKTKDVLTTHRIRSSLNHHD